MPRPPFLCAPERSRLESEGFQRRAEYGGVLAKCDLRFCCRMDAVYSAGREKPSDSSPEHAAGSYVPLELGASYPAIPHFAPIRPVCLASSTLLLVVACCLSKRAHLTYNAKLMSSRMDARRL